VALRVLGIDADGVRDFRIVVHDRRGRGGGDAREINIATAEIS
jgi:hypothetical protein